MYVYVILFFLFLSCHRRSTSVIYYDALSKARVQFLSSLPADARLNPFTVTMEMQSIITVMYSVAFAFPRAVS